MSRRRVPLAKIRTSGGFWLLAGVLLLAVSGRVLAWFCLACLVHELGHAGAIRLLGGRVETVSLTGCGAVLRSSRRRLPTYGEECAAALAGPAASLLLALLAAAWGRRFGSGDAFLLAGLSLALAVFNLVPAGPLDGGRVLRALLSRFFGPDRGERVCRGITVALSAGLAGLGLWCLFHGGNITLLLCAGWLLAQQKGEKRA